MLIFEFRHYTSPLLLFRCSDINSFILKFFISWRYVVWIKPIASFCSNTFLCSFDLSLIWHQLGICHHKANCWLSCFWCNFNLSYTTTITTTTTIITKSYLYYQHIFRTTIPITIVRQFKINWRYRLDWEFAFDDDNTLFSIRRK